MNVYDGTGVNHGMNLPPDDRNMVGANKFLEQQPLGCEPKRDDTVVDRRLTIGTINKNEGRGSIAVNCKCIVKYRIMTKMKACRGCGS